MINGREFYHHFKAMLPQLPDEMRGRDEEFRHTFGWSKPFRARLLMRRGIAYLVNTVINDASLPLHDRLAFVGAITRPELLRDPELGMREMAYRASQTQIQPLELAYELASDVFYAGRAAKSCPLNNADPLDAPTAPYGARVVGPFGDPETLDSLLDDVVDDAAHH